MVPPRIETLVGETRLSSSNVSRSFRSKTICHVDAILFVFSTHFAVSFTFRPNDPCPRREMPRTLCSPSCAPSVPPHRHSLLLLNHIAQVCQRTLELPAIDGLCGFAGVFERDTEVSAASAGGFRGLD